MHTNKTFYRFCLNCCAIDVDLEDGKPMALRGDTDSHQSNVRKQGLSTNALASDEKYFDPITRQARQSAIPVNIKAI